MKSVNPYLNFDGNAEEAFQFYQTVFGGDLEISRYKDLNDNMGATGSDLNKIANVMLPIGGGTMLFGSDITESMGQPPQHGTNFSIQLETDSEAETEQLFNGLSENGDVIMPLMETEWADLFGMFTDRFGTRWMVYYPGNKS